MTTLTAPKTVFVTVGSTKFDDLIAAVLCERFFDALKSQEFTRLIVQCGNSELHRNHLLPSDLENKTQWSWNDGSLLIEVWRFQPSLEDVFKIADVVISHSGSGTILDVLRLPKPLIVVPNDTLLDNHQAELALALSEKGHLVATTVS